MSGFNLLKTLNLLSTASSGSTIYNPRRIPYCFTVSAKYRGKFLLSYGKNHHEYITLTPNGLEFRKQTFRDVNTLINLFKQNFREVLVGCPMASSRPLPSSGGQHPPPQQQSPSRFGR
uniref:Spt6 SH2 domain-containing protein n=1 Tax=Panagrolaimus sp. PS1159 TaxID=55785 RepID=A0AC35F0B3_9BILA